MKPYSNHDQYLKALEPKQRAALQALRRSVHAAAPGAEEVISYGLPSFRFEGRALICYGGWKEHCALYPMSLGVIDAFASELKAFETEKGTIRFQANKPLSAALVKKIVKARIAQNRERSAAAAAKKASRKAVPKRRRARA